MIVSNKISLKTDGIIFVIAILLILTWPKLLTAQKNNNFGTLLWQIRDTQSGHVSYLFGTNHGFGASWLDSVTNVKEKFLQSQHVFVEIYRRTSDTNLVKELSQSYKGVPLVPSKIFKGRYYDIVKTYVKTLGWGNIDTLFAHAGKAQTLILWGLAAELNKEMATRLHTISPGEDNLDNYFAKQAIILGKPQSNLDDSIAVTVNLNDRQKPEVFAKQIGQFAEFLQKSNNLKFNKDFNLDYIDLKNNYHFNENAPKGTEKDGLDVSHRNDLWVQKLKDALQNENCFIGVGLGHLYYKEGLINQLKKAGFEVVPVPMQRIKE
jgi:uncharacterized protein YbaP (TraB family)